ncbi:MAG: DUF4198 domain-containing protein [Acetobacteraceae bacterium]|uniref:DUF4198 domain-containing protein n=1 Tax=Bradyrhizobium sp. TaxID=376 RepID=UPI003D0E2291
MKTNRFKTLFQTGAAAGLLLGAATSHAHFPWVMATDYTPSPDKAATVYLGWGHSFPLAGFMAEDRVGTLELVSPDGSRSGLEKKDAGYATPELKTAGAYVLLAAQKGGFYTRTKSGNKRQSKEGLSDIIKCSFSSNTMKAVFNVGAGAGDVSKRFEHPLEIIPLDNPGNLGVNDHFKVQVLLHGKPYDGMIYATYAGFSNEENTFAYAVGTDDDGTASIRILSTGTWLIKANAEQPYPDTKVCDVESYTSTFTFGIQ